MWIMQLLAHGGEFLPGDWYLKQFDKNARNGLGQVTVTQDMEAAIHFEDIGDLMRTWRAQSTLVPLRDDGKPNRPLTAFTIQPINLGADK